MLASHLEQFVFKVRENPLHLELLDELQASFPHLGEFISGTEA